MEQHQSFVNDISGVHFLFKLFFQSYSLTIGMLVALNVVTTGIKQAALPLTVAPAVNIILGEHHPPAVAWNNVTLDNLGPSIMAWLGYISDDNLLITPHIGGAVAGVMGRCEDYIASILLNKLDMLK